MTRHEYLVQGNLTMAHGSVLRIEDGRDLLLYVWEGALWLTQEGDVRDRYVPAGGTFRIERQGLALASAIGRSAVSITSPEPELYAERIVLVRPGAPRPVELYSAAREPASFGARLARFWTGLFAPRARSTTAAL